MSIIVWIVCTGLILFMLYSRVQTGGASTGTGTTDVWKEWLKKFKWEYLAWIFFAYVVWDLFGKFVSPRVPVEWKEWVPSFSWNTFEVLVLVVGVGILWTSRAKKDEMVIVSSNNSSKKEVNRGETATKKTGFAPLKITFLLLFFSAALFLAFSGIHQPGNMSPVPPEGMVYVPAYGTLVIAAWSAAIALLWSLYDETDSTALFFPIGIILLCLGFWYGLSHNLFAPTTSDVLVPWWGGFLGALAVYVFVALLLTRRDETKVITIIALVILWLSQFPDFRAIIHSFG